SAGETLSLGDRPELPRALSTATMRAVVAPTSSARPLEDAVTPTTRLLLPNRNFALMGERSMLPASFVTDFFTAAVSTWGPYSPFITPKWIQLRTVAAASVQCSLPASSTIGLVLGAAAACASGVAP